VRHISNPNTTSKTPNTNTADKRHQINPPFHQKACYAPAIKSKEEALKHQKAQHPTTENTKATSSRPRTAPPQQRKAGQTQPDPLSSHHKGTLSKDNPSTPQPSRRNTSHIPQCSTWNKSQRLQQPALSPALKPHRGMPRQGEAQQLKTFTQAPEDRHNELRNRPLRTFETYHNELP